MTNKDRKNPFFITPIAGASTLLMNTKPTQTIRDAREHEPKGKLLRQRLY
ncbi:hypothetical protein [Mechercharimyces sp. CAU 1602]|nr:hypothetical protein [Mechercharimyces sp. CAU 1602]